MAILVKHDSGEVEQLIPANGVSFSLGELQKAVGGYIEAYRMFNGSWFVCNIDGKGLKLPINRMATILLHNSVEHRVPGDVVVGNVVIATELEMNGPEENEDA